MENENSDQGEGVNEDSISESQEEYESFLSSDDDDKHENEQDTSFVNKPIYNGSRIFLDEFELCFMWICNILCLPIVHRNLLLQFIKILLPYPNEIKSYYIMTNKILNNKRDEKLYNICSYCYEKLKDDKCLNRECFNKAQIHNKLNKKDRIAIVSFDFISQL